MIAISTPAIRSLITVAVVALATMTSAAHAQTCKRDGTAVSCDDGRRGIFSGNAIIWSDGTRSSAASPHPSVIIGNKSSIHVGQGVFVGQGSGGVALDDPSAPNKSRCAILDGLSYCY